MRTSHHRTLSVLLFPFIARVSPFPSPHPIPSFTKLCDRFTCHDPIWKKNTNCRTPKSARRRRRRPNLYSRRLALFNDEEGVERETTSFSSVEEQAGNVKKIITDNTTKTVNSKDPQYSLNDEIDSFLHGDVNFTTENDEEGTHHGPEPLPSMGPGEVIDAALRAFRNTADKQKAASVLLRFHVPLSRGERWGGGTTVDPWKEVLRGSITPTMLASRIRASSQFSCLLDWETLAVTEGFFTEGVMIAYVNAAMFFGESVEPSIIQFTLKKIGGVWLIDTAVVSKKEWFLDDDGESGGS